MKPFDYTRATTVPDAVAGGAQPGAKFLAAEPTWST